MELVLPDKAESITVKIHGKMEKAGESKDSNYFLPVYIWGDVKKTVFRMKITKTIWRSIDDILTMRYELGGDAGDESVDEDLQCLIGKIITITGIPDMKRIFINKEGKADSPKIFIVDLREDLMDIEREGGQIYIDTVNEEYSKSNGCVYVNLTMADNVASMLLAKEKALKKKEKIAEKIKKLGDGGWNISSH